MTIIFVLALVATAAAWTPPHRGSTRFFLDSADIDSWRELLPTGLFHGVTTNPTILERCGQRCSVNNIQLLAKLALTYTNEFMCQSWGSSVDEMVETGCALAAPNKSSIVVKVPVTKMGLEAATIMMRDHSLRVCLTACYNSQQTLLAAAIGAEYLAPYLGRMSDLGKNGAEECLTMLDIVDGLQSETRIVVASLRDASSIADLASSGMDTFTFSPDIARQLLSDPLTDQAATDFEQAAKRNN